MGVGIAEDGSAKLDGKILRIQALCSAIRHILERCDSMILDLGVEFRWGMGIDIRT